MPWARVWLHRRGDRPAHPRLGSLAMAGTLQLLPSPSLAHRVSAPENAMSDKGSGMDGKTDIVNGKGAGGDRSPRAWGLLLGGSWRRLHHAGSLSSSPEEMSAEEGRETSSGIEVEASDLSLSLTGDDVGPNCTSTESRDTDTESSGEEKDSDSMDDTGHYSINEENRALDRSHSEEEEEEEEEEEQRSHRRAQRKRANHDQDSSDDEQALEDWVSSETTALPQPRWQAVHALRERELGSSARFVYEACGARVFVQRFRLQHGLEGHTGCVNTLHFNQRGTWLASGSDDLKVVVWDWVRRQPVLEFESGHKSNVFQVRRVRGGSSEGWGVRGPPRWAGACSGSTSVQLDDAVWGRSVSLQRRAAGGAQPLWGGN